MRQRIALYRNAEAFDAVAAADAANAMHTDDDGSSDDGAELDVPLDELLEDLAFLGMADENPEADDVAGLLSGMDVEALQD